jgi:hypothetical protein
MYEALNGLGLLDDIKMIGDDLELIEKKIADILEEKRRHQGIGWKH